MTLIYVLTYRFSRHDVHDCRSICIDWPRHCWSSDLQVWLQLHYRAVLGRLKLAPLIHVHDDGSSKGHPNGRRPSRDLSERGRVTSIKAQLYGAFGDQLLEQEGRSLEWTFCAPFARYSAVYVFTIL